MEDIIQRMYDAVREAKKSSRDTATDLVFSRDAWVEIKPLLEKVLPPEVMVRWIFSNQTRLDELPIHVADGDHAAFRNANDLFRAGKRPEVIIRSLSSPKAWISVSYWRLAARIEEVCRGLEKLFPDLENPYETGEPPPMNLPFFPDGSPPPERLPFSGLPFYPEDENDEKEETT